MPRWFRGGPSRGPIPASLARGCPTKPPITSQLTQPFHQHCSRLLFLPTPLSSNPKHSTEHTRSTFALDDITIFNMVERLLESSKSCINKYYSCHLKRNQFISEIWNYFILENRHVFSENVSLKVRAFQKFFSVKKIYFRL